MASLDPKRTRRKSLLTGIALNVFILGVVSLLNDVSSEMIYPILPLFLTAIGASGLVIGLIEGAAETTASLVKVFSGWYSDRLPRRKPLITGGYTLSMITKPFLAVAVTPLQVLGIRVTERVGKGIRSAPRDALIADSTSQEYQGRAFGLHKAFDSSGAVIGPILVIPVLLAASSITTGTYRLVFWLSTIPVLVSVSVLVLFVREKAVVRTGHTGTFLKDVGQLGKPFYMLMAVVLTFYIGEISYAFMVLRAYEEGIGTVDSITVNTILLYVLYNSLFVLVAFPAGILSDNLGRRPVIIGSFLIFAGASAVMAIANSWWVLAISFAMFGVYKGTSEGVFKAFVTDVVPSNLRGTALGAFHTSVGLVMLPGGIIAGYLWDNVGHWATFAYGSLTAITAIVLLLAVRTSKKVTPDEQPERSA